MKEYRVTFTFSAPDDISFTDVEEWVQFYLHYRGGLSEANPMLKARGDDLEPTSFRMVERW